MVRITAVISCYLPKASHLQHHTPCPHCLIEFSQKHWYAVQSRFPAFETRVNCAYILQLLISPDKYLKISGKESACNAGAIGDVGLSPVLRRTPGGEQGNPFQCSCLRILCTEEPGELQSIRSQRDRHA